MHLHFYTSITDINHIQEGYEGIVRLNEFKLDTDVHVSIDIDKYQITRLSDTEYGVRPLNPKVYIL